METSVAGSGQKLEVASEGCPVAPAVKSVTGIFSLAFAYGDNYWMRYHQIAEHMMRNWINLCEGVPFVFRASPQDLVSRMREELYRLDDDDIHDDDEDSLDDDGNLRVAIAQAQQALIPICEQDTILIHRGLVLSHREVENLEPGISLGVCWSYDRSTAQSIRRAPDLHSAEVTVTARVSSRDVDWTKSLLLHLNHENELRIEHGSPLVVEEIVVAGVSVRPDLTGKSFKA